MTTWKLMIAATIIAATAAPFAAAREYYVLPSGDDKANGSQARPWKTISRAVRAAGPDVIVHVGNGVYRESVLIVKGGAEGKRFVLQSAEGHRAVLDGGFEQDTGVMVKAAWVTVRGLEVRNYRFQGIYMRGPGAHHVLVERNIVHHISSSLTGEGKGAQGIRAVAVSDCHIRQNTVYFVVGNSECFGVLFDLRSSHKVPIRNMVIEKNLFYLLDKSGVRIVDNTHPAAERCHVVATPIYIRENISIHNAYVGFEVNYVNSFLTEGVGPLGDKKGEPVYTDDNFVGWIGCYGINPKESNDGITRHNTVYRSSRIGYLQSGKPSTGMRIEGNLIVDNPIGSVIHTEGTDNVFTGNYYRQAAPWLDFFWDRTHGWGTTYTDIADLRRNSKHHPEQKGVLNNGARLFVAPEKGDFRLLKRCPAVRSAPDGEDFGARESRLREVGASAKYGLGNVPLIPEVTGLRVVAVSSEDSTPGDSSYSDRSKALNFKKISTGAARHAADGVRITVWRPAKGTTSGWIVFELPGDKPVPLGTFVLLVSRTGYKKGYRRHPCDVKLYVRSSGAEAWKEAGEYRRYIREEGRIFPIEGSPKARQVKLEILSNHGAPVMELSEFKLYRPFEPIE